jgi:16S rRNA (guanine1207-N2)-methyltransferase
LARLGLGASAWLVVNRHLGADSLSAWLEGRGYEVHRQASKSGYRVLQVGMRSSAGPAISEPAP